MGLTDTLRALNIINKAAKFIKIKEDKTNQIHTLYREICDAVCILQEKKELIQEYLNKAQEIIIKLRRLV